MTLEFFFRLFLQDYKRAETERDFLTAKGFYDEISHSHQFFFHRNNPDTEFFSKIRKNVVFLGGSSLRGCYPTRPLYKNLQAFKKFIPAFPELLEKKMAGYPANYLNMAIGGFNSHSILKGLREYETLINAGDIFIFYEGFNDKFVRFLDNNYETDIYRVKLNFYISCLSRYSIFVRVVKYNFVNLKLQLADIFQDSTLKNLFLGNNELYLRAFYLNLMKINEIIKAHKATLILTTQISNSCRHKIEYSHAAGNGLLNSCVNFITENKIRDWYYLLNCYSQLNANDKFYFHLMVAIEFQKTGVDYFAKHFRIMNHKCIRYFFDLPTNEVIRAVAKKNNVELVDFSEEFRRNYFDSTGYEYFVDEIHPNIAAHKMLADILEPVLKKHLVNQQW